MYSSIPAASVHGERLGHERIEALGSEMCSSGHRSDDAGECEEVSLLRAQDRLRLEEWDDLRQQVFPLAHNTRVESALARWFA
jgi:hypothetical protein